jgi:leader peptidase (prepilin peptidase)/N-methyltransferase
MAAADRDIDLGQGNRAGWGVLMQPALLFATPILAAMLVALSAIDLASRRLPDWLTLPLAALGLGGVLMWDASSLAVHLLAALVGFLCFWSTASLYRRFRGQDGLGLGDAKLLAAAGAWLGPLYLAPVVFTAAVLALAAVAVLRIAGRQISLQSSVPFGPFLSAGFFGFWCVEAGARLP